MSILDLTKNFALGQVSVGYDAVATTIALIAGNGAKFPTAPFDATWWNITDWPISAQDPQREIVRVTAGPPTDVFTIIRGQETSLGGLAASVKNIPGKVYMLEAGLTALMMSQINSNLGLPVLTTKGDLLGFDTAQNRIPIGANTFVLTADSTQALGLKWAAAASGSPYTQAFTAQTTITITAATHGKGVWPIVTIYDNSAPANFMFGAYTVAANGDVVITFAVSQSGTVVIK